MKRLVVLGGGESGVGTAILGMKKGYQVFVSDFGKIKPNYKEVLINHGIAWEEEIHTESLILNADVVMKSPGIPEKSPIVKKLALCIAAASEPAEAHIHGFDCFW